MKLQDHKKSGETFLESQLTHEVRTAQLADDVLLLFLFSSNPATFLTSNRFLSCSSIFRSYELDPMRCSYVNRDPWIERDLNTRIGILLLPRLLSIRCSSELYQWIWVLRWVESAILEYCRATYYTRQKLLYQSSLFPPCSLFHSVSWCRSILWHLGEQIFSLIHFFFPSQNVRHS